MYNLFCMNNIEKAVTILEENITSTPNVSEWAKIIGFEKTSKFSWEFRKHFGLRPKEVLLEIRVKKIKDYIISFPTEKNYSVAIEFGFANEKRLYKFLKRHTGCSPTQLRKRLTKKANESTGLN